uniref:Uncharacterized protein n=1 Tax=Pipistrellus kuhlii TaxID=59472 RepID=A0A7J7VBF7_PIPKU|nr:hypothetical protein mPipKuh1_008470 [Pipistrellus kuhlii]
MSARVPIGLCRLPAATNHHQLGGLKQQKCVPHSPAGQKSDQGVGGATPPPEALGEPLPRLLHLRVAPGTHRLLATSLKPLPLSSRCFLPHVSGSFLTLMKILVIEFRAQPNSECSHPEILTFLTSTKTPIPIRPHSVVPGGHVFCDRSTIQP